MIEFLCGCSIGGCLTFIIAVMFMSSRKPRVVALCGQQVEYTNSKGNTMICELANDMHDNDEYAVLRAQNTTLEFVAKVSGIKIL